MSTQLCYTEFLKPSKDAGVFSQFDDTPEASRKLAKADAKKREQEGPEAE